MNTVASDGCPLQYSYADPLNTCFVWLANNCIVYFVYNYY